MNENDVNEKTEPLVTEPEQEINTLSDVEITPLEDEKALDGLPYLVRKVYPYTLGLMLSFVKYLPIIVLNVWKYSFLMIYDWLVEAQRKADADKLYYLKEVFGYSDEVLEQQANAQKFNPIFGFLVYLFDIAYSCVVNVVSEIQIKKAIILRRRNIDLPSQIPSPESIVTAYIKTLDETDKHETLLSELGLGDTERQVYLDAVKQIPDLNILFQNLWRGEISPTEFGTYLAKLAFDEDEQKIITNIVDRIPPIQDIIRFAVREAFHEELSLKYRHDEEFPEEVAKWSEKQGFPEHWAKKYWRAHWELPSVQMVFEMLHRKVLKDDGKQFTKQDMNDLLKMADFAPSWRNLLTQISYRVITRVDARRMYDMGVWDNLPDMSAEEKVNEVYEKQGYNSEDAQYMTDFTVHYTEQKRRSFTTAGLKKLRKYGIISEETFIEKLQTLRVREAEIEYLVDEVNYELEDKKLDSFMDYAKAMYLNERWNKTEVQIEMSKIGLHISDPDNLFEAWDYDKKAKRRVLSKTDIQRLLKKGVIRRYTDAITKLMDLGYDENSANWLIEEIIFDLSSEPQILVHIGVITSWTALFEHLKEIGNKPEEAVKIANENWDNWKVGK